MSHCDVIHNPVWSGRSLAARAGHLGLLWEADEDEVHFALECPAYAVLHGFLFASLPPDPELANRLLSCSPHVRLLAPCTSCWAGVACGGLRPRALPFESDPHFVFALPRHEAVVLVWCPSPCLGLLVVVWFFVDSCLVVAVVVFLYA